LISICFLFLFFLRLTNFFFFWLRTVRL
jgi:hypothetical protein